MSKILGLFVVGVVGSTSKVTDARDLGCDVVIDKSIEDLWTKAEEASPTGYSTIMDANGVSTLNESYDHLAPSGRLVVFGFHSNLPLGSAMLSPLECGVAAHGLEGGVHAEVRRDGFDGLE
jgi:NADPH:quinone reductase-like Zn-dependent oxidoreductase